MMKLLISGGGDVNLCNKNGASPVYIAAENGHAEAVRLLLDNGASPNTAKVSGFVLFASVCCILKATPIGQHHVLSVHKTDTEMCSKCWRFTEQTLMRFD